MIRGGLFAELSSLYKNKLQLLHCDCERIQSLLNSYRPYVILGQRSKLRSFNFTILFCNFNYDNQNSPILLASNNQQSARKQLSSQQVAK